MANMLSAMQRFPGLGMGQQMQGRPAQMMPAQMDPQRQQAKQQAQQQYARMMPAQQVRPGQQQSTMMGSIGNPIPQDLSGARSPADPEMQRRMAEMQRQAQNPMQTMASRGGSPGEMSVASFPGMPRPDFDNIRPPPGLMGPPKPNAGVRDDGRSANDLARQLARGNVSSENTADVQSEITRLENERFAPQTPQPITSPKLPGPLGGQPLNPRPVFETDTTDVNNDGVFDDLSGDEVPAPQPMPFSPFSPGGPFGGKMGGIGSLFDRSGQENQRAAQRAAPLQPQPYQPVPANAPNQMQGGYGLSNYQDDKFSKGVMSLPQIQENFYSRPPGNYTAPAIQSPYQMF